MLHTSPAVLVLGIAWGMAPVAATAQPSPVPDGEVPRLSEVTVSSTRTERRIDNVPNTVSVIPNSRIEQQGARDIKDVFRNEIDVTVRAAPTRFTAAGQEATGRAGNESINIRGLEGNQVLMLEDGIRVPNSFSFGPFATGRGDFLDIDGFKTVEVLRGPASIQFGSDGLAGAVSFITFDPADILKVGQQVGGFARSSYVSLDRSWNDTLAVAGKTGQWQGLLLGSYRQGHETKNRGSDNALNTTRTTANPVDYHSQYLLGKAQFAVNADHQLGVVFETRSRKQMTEVYSARDVPPLTFGRGRASTTDLDANDRVERNRISLEHRFNDINASWVQKAETRVYWQDAKVSQWATEQRYRSIDRNRDNRYEQNLVGISTLLESNLTTGMNQRLSYGFDWSRADIMAQRSGTVPPRGEQFPSKPFPDTAYTLVGAFVQSEIEAGVFSIIPGLRFDYYRLSPSTQGYSEAVNSLADQAVTPRLGVVWRLTPSFAPYAQVATGFRAPTPYQVNNGFTNLAGYPRYQSIGNRNLKAEHADSVELGFRGKLDSFRYSMAAYDNRYQDFISLQMVRGSGSVRDPLTYQHINLSKARIRGVEARAEWQMAKRWLATAGAAYSRGTSETKGIESPLNTIQPLRAVLGLTYHDGAWGARANLLFSQAKEADRIALDSTARLAKILFAPPSYTVLDLGAYWKPIRNLTLNANVNNIFNTKYWQWSDVYGLASNSDIKDAYTAPGRNVQLSARYDF